MVSVTLLLQIAPSVGVVIATALFSSPIGGVLQIRRDGALGVCRHRT